MSSINLAIIVGRVGRDCELRYTSGGTAVTDLSVATSETWKDKNTGERKEETEWHTCVLWGRMAEVAAEHAKKGALVSVTGAITTETWMDKNTGEKRYRTKIKARDLRLLSKPGGTQGTRENVAPEEPEAEEPEEQDIPF